MNQLFDTSELVRAEQRFISGETLNGDMIYYAFRRHKSGELVLTPIERHYCVPRPYSPLSKNIALNRLKMGFTQKKLAEKVGVGEKSLAKYEECRAEPCVETLVKLCEVFEVDDMLLFLTKEGKK